MKVDICLAELEKMKSTPTTEHVHSTSEDRSGGGYLQRPPQRYQKCCTHQLGEGFVSRNNDCQLEEEAGNLFRKAIFKFINLRIYYMFHPGLNILLVSSRIV